MAGGYGYSVQVPMEVPQDPPLRYLDDDMPEVVFPREMPLPEIKDASAQFLRVKNKALPEKPGGDIERRGRMEEAVELAEGMRVAFGITKQYNKLNRARAKAKGKAQERLAQHRPKDSIKSGKKYANRKKSMERYSSFRAAGTYGHHPYDGMY